MAILRKILVSTLTVLVFMALPCQGFVGNPLLPASKPFVALGRREAPADHKNLLSRSGRTEEYLFSKRTAIHSKSPRQKQEEEQSIFQLPSPYTLLIDASAILLAVEFVGLLNEVNDVNFVRNGGWFQPLPPLQEQSLSISKVLQGWILNITVWATTLTLVPVAVGEELWTQRPKANPWTTRFLPCMFGFCTLRILYPVVMATWSGSELALDSALLDVYMVALSLGTARYLLGNE